MVEKIREEKDEVARLEDGNWRRVWPAPIKPLEDELLSSWLVRLSEAHGLTFSNFCRAVWPKKGVMLLDLEVLPKAEVINTLTELPHRLEMSSGSYGTVGIEMEKRRSAACNIVLSA